MDGKAVHPDSTQDSHAGLCRLPQLPQQVQVHMCPHWALAAYRGPDQPDSLPASSLPLSQSLFTRQGQGGARGLRGQSQSPDHTSGGPGDQGKPAGGSPEPRSQLQGCRGQGAHIHTQTPAGTCPFLGEASSIGLAACSLCSRAASNPAGRRGPEPGSSSYSTHRLLSGSLAGPVGAAENTVHGMSV